MILWFSYPYCRIFHLAPTQNNKNLHLTMDFIFLLNFRRDNLCLFITRVLYFVDDGLNIWIYHMDGFLMKYIYLCQTKAIFMFVEEVKYMQYLRFLILCIFLCKCFIHKTNIYIVYGETGWWWYVNSVCMYVYFTPTTVTHPSIPHSSPFVYPIRKVAGFECTNSN